MTTISYSPGLAPSTLSGVFELSQTSISMLSPLFIEGPVTGVTLPTHLTSAAHLLLSLEPSLSYPCSTDVLVHVGKTTRNIRHSKLITLL